MSGKIIRKLQESKCDLIWFATIVCISPYDAACESHIMQLFETSCCTEKIISHRQLLRRIMLDQ